MEEEMRRKNKEEETERKTWLYEYTDELGGSLEDGKPQSTQYLDEVKI